MRFVNDIKVRVLMLGNVRVLLYCTSEQISFLVLGSQRVSDMPISTSPTSPILTLLLCRRHSLIDLCVRKNTVSIDQHNRLQLTNDR
jgi:hypothetical protein